MVIRDRIKTKPTYHADIAGLAMDVRGYDPHLALTPGGDGLDRRQVPERGLQPQGFLELPSREVRVGRADAAEPPDLAPAHRELVGGRPEAVDEGVLLGARRILQEPDVDPVGFPDVFGGEGLVRGHGRELGRRGASLQLQRRHGLGGFQQVGALAVYGAPAQGTIGERRVLAPAKTGILVGAAPGSGAFRTDARGGPGARATLPFNGYAEQVAHLYTGMDLRKNY